MGELGEVSRQVLGADVVVAAMQRTLDVAQEIERTGLGADGGCGVSTPRALTPVGACLHACSAQAGQHEPWLPYNTAFRAMT